MEEKVRNPFLFTAYFPDPETAIGQRLSPLFLVPAIDPTTQSLCHHKNHDKLTTVAVLPASEGLKIQSIYNGIQLNMIYICTC